MALTEKLMEKMVKQCRKPTGRFGRLLARRMNYGSHRKLAEWGLSHASISFDGGCSLIAVNNIYGEYGELHNLQLETEELSAEGTKKKVR